MEERKLYGTNETALILNYAYHFCVISAFIRVSRVSVFCHTHFHLFSY